MARFLKSRVKAKGAAPGSLIFMGKQKMDDTRIRLFQYSKETITEKEFETIDEALESINNTQNNWLNIDGLHNTELIKQIGEHFKISPLALENILNTGQRAKFFEDNNSVTLITKAVYYNQEENKVSVEQISFILLENVLISFQEQIGDHFEPVRNRIRSSFGKIRQRKTDYLLYALTDSLVDNYLINLEQIGLNIEALEEKLDNPTKEISKTLFRYKTEISYLRKSIKPLKEVLTRILRAKSEIISEEHLVFYQELYDIEEQAIEAADSYFGMTNDLINLYNTNLSNKVNEVMKVLTIFASIFIPLTFIAGIYGTNFEYVPELHFKNAYFVMWGVMVVVAGTMLYYFKKHKWF
ncbi:magnesium/cobalt transporter CorA [uncultured Draconibacterium sp.]|uniref:magnesium/cobalt transporter CorA n=1 Tax=uncultured Draconibacterium sp. TaxID=1573823 RepID=UPI0029C95483|nr:magnesium/cobalt transporter CorA [uncultured Draconibacterium sp.]